MKKEIATICCLVGMAAIQLITASASRSSTEPDNVVLALSPPPSLCEGGPNRSDITAGCFLAEEDGEALMMDSEVHRRLALEADGKTILYPTLNEDRPTCNSRVRPYATSCLPPTSNSRTQGCNPIYQCRH